MVAPKLYRHQGKSKMTDLKSWYQNLIYFKIYNFWKHSKEYEWKTVCAEMKVFLSQCTHLGSATINTLHFVEDHRQIILSVTGVK